MSVLFPNEKVVLSYSASVEQPVRGKGELYLTDRRLLLVHRSGVMRKRETALFDISFDKVSYLKVEGLIRKALVIGVTSQGGAVITYRVRVPDPTVLVAKFNEVAVNTPTAKPQFKRCVSCARKIPADAEFCPYCGERQVQG
ncbi:MAG: zinc ribbon domain-containing protein [Nitrososphaerota archaeon]|nr:zinc ribbon domain-containing protein [Nitrososphaerota archaeon]MDG6936517.1 zinc ribbon domain-containing protein [Nitrososphaerota archaeon]MDG6944992.1 zinc ribbon domain-containing protein [Nitrososphaerota archaeon]